MDVYGGVLEGSGIEPGSSRWADAATWRGDGLRREVFFFQSGGTQLYGSLYAAEEIRRPVGVVCCNSWGVEADRSDPLQRAVALAMARRGGAGLVFHYPGYGDSFGDLARVGLEDLQVAAADAVAEAARRCAGLEWILAGFMLGASIAVLAHRPAGVRRLLLVQPSLRPGGYFRWLAQSAARVPLRFGVTEGMAHGYPLPGTIFDSAAEADAATAAALADFDGELTAIRHVDEAPAWPSPDSLPARCRLLEVSGRWRFGSKEEPELAGAASQWLDRVAGGRRR